MDASNDSVLVALSDSLPQQTLVRFASIGAAPTRNWQYSSELLTLPQGRSPRRTYLPIVIAFLVALSTRRHLQIVRP
ncbi:hypothetical protein C8R45DRAFT_1111666 [Mycena sanguinolenta]|nr:hypothetical protein C8R45DRAFT_1111666 [Mycena sanguinolenta]